MEVGGKRLNIFMIDEAYGANLPGGTYPLECTSKDPEFNLRVVLGTAKGGGPVLLAGKKLYSALVAHKPVQDFFAQTNPSPSALPQYFPLYIRVDTPDAEELPWEILWETQKSFMILDPQGRWPIARLASMPKQAEPLHKNIWPALRLAVVLAAAGESGTEEWGNISNKFADLKAPLNVLGLVSEDTAKEAMTKDADSWAAADPVRKVEVDYVGDGNSLVNRLRSYAPNVIHIFCHGVADVRPELELETRSDRLAKCKQGSVRFKSEDLLPLASMDSLWLVVLNCCQAAKPAPQLHSLARDLVAAGVPAVVAMRESVEVNDANLFAEHFYPALFAQLNSTFAARNMKPPQNHIPFQEIVWVKAAHEARRKLSSSSQRLPDDSLAWTYPVVYVNRDQLHLHPRELEAAVMLTAQERLELIAKLDLLRAIREPLTLAIDAEASKRRTDIDVEIHQIEVQLAGG
jgi:hypothetical protein